MSITIKTLGLQPYESTWQAMRDFTELRQENTPDELWIVEHPAVLTQGLNGKAEHLLQTLHDIPLVQTDRGGQITYHGPGQLVIYVLFDLKRAKLGVRALVTLIEESIIEYLHQLGIMANARADAPGVYVNQQKIASLGLKIRKQRSYHGLALNVDMDLSPFELINPCGLNGMLMTQLSDLLPVSSTQSLHQSGEALSTILKNRLTTFLV
ncbi:MAG: lipoyl(octanoyl) transferase LipB [Thiomicrorhabdus sp.]|jgi:lipoyl(octanoyl) transferase|nr:lipoyl(octanoyl) transferase LipB [Thiomicrorhabdus sp.]